MTCLQQSLFKVCKTKLRAPKLRAQTGRTTRQSRGILLGTGSDEAQEQLAGSSRALKAVSRDLGGVVESDAFCEPAVERFTSAGFLCTPSETLRLFQPTTGPSTMSRLRSDCPTTLASLQRPSTHR